MAEMNVLVLDIYNVQACLDVVYYCSNCLLGWQVDHMQRHKK